MSMERSSPQRELRETTGEQEPWRWPFLWWPSRWWRAPSRTMGWSPPIDVFERGDDFVVRAELPGMKREDIGVSATGTAITIAGERTAPEVSDKDYHVCETCYGPFSRTVTLPSTADTSKVEASFENGVLELTVPKSEAARPRKIAVKSRT